MKSHEVIRKAVENPGVKAIAAALRISPALVYKWCEPQPVTEAGNDQSGVKNPLDRVREIYHLTKDIRVIRWLCTDAGGFYVANPVLNQPADDEAVFKRARQMVRDFSELLDAITTSYENDEAIDPKEASQIRGRWEELKSAVEGFVIDCERGHFHPTTSKRLVKESQV